MSLTDLKLTQADFNSKKIADLSDNPSSDGMTAAALKAYFDYIPVIMIGLGAINNIIDELSGTDGAADIGIETIDGIIATNVQEALEKIKLALNQVESGAAADLTAHEQRTDNPHTVTKTQIGLSNVDNTSDINKPISTAASAALALKEAKSDADQLLSSVEYNPSTGVFQFKDRTGAVKKQVDLNIEKIPANIKVEKRTGVWYLVITNTDSTETSCPVTDLFNDTTFPADANYNVGFDVTQNADGSKVVKANVKVGGITNDMLAEEVMQTIISYNTSAGNYAEDAEDSAELSSEYARGRKLNGSNVVSGEPGYNDNAKYYKEQAASSASFASNDAASAQQYAGQAGTSATNAGNSAINANDSKIAAAAKALIATAKAILAESWAVGGTGTREGEDTNNAKYWAEQAGQIAGGRFVTQVNGIAPEGDISGPVSIDPDDLDDTNTIHKFITAAERILWGSKYDKPSGGIPDSDIVSAAVWNGKGDMHKTGYDNDNTVLNAGGIAAYAIAKAANSAIPFAIGVDADGLYFKFEED